MKDQYLLDKYAPAIRALGNSPFTKLDQLPEALLMDRHKELSIFYTPFETVNQEAKIVLVGITPGITQISNALLTAKAKLDTGATNHEVLLAAKKAAGFSGKLRKPLVEMLDHAGVNRWLRINTCASLFAENSHLVHTTSMVRHATFRGLYGFRGTPGMHCNPLLRRYVLEHFAKEAPLLKGKPLVAMGNAVIKGLHWLAAEGLIDKQCIIDGLPHPSGENGEGIAYFLRRKERSLVTGINVDKADAGKARMLARFAVA